jgi:hypothetical protein
VVAGNRRPPKPAGQFILTARLGPDSAAFPDWIEPFLCYALFSYFTLIDSINHKLSVLLRSGGIGYEARSSVVEQRQR